MSKNITDEVKSSCFEFAQNPIVLGAKWKNEQTFSQSDTERVPTIWKTIIGGCRISIIYGHPYKPEGWVITCYQFQIEQKELNATSALGAAMEALEFCKLKVSTMYLAFSRLQ
jgi:hypothetical protein